MKTQEQRAGAAITKAIETLGPGTACPSLEEIAVLVDGSCDVAKRDELMGHFAACGRCREIFVATRALVSEESPAAKGNSWILPSAFAAAALVIIALSLTLTGTAERERSLAKVDPAPVAPAPAPVVAVSEAPEVPAPPAARPAEPGAPLGSPVELARQLAASADHQQLAALAAAPRKNHGFAGSGNANRLAFGIGAAAVDLEVALVTGDGERAQLQASRLGSLLQAIAADDGAEELERLVAKLEAGEKPAALAGQTGKLNRLVPRDQLSYLQLGAWTEGARLAARTGNKGYFAAGVPSQLGKALARQKGGGETLKALQGVEQTLAARQELDMNSVEAALEALLKTL